jgi:hypothetical protein
MHMNEIYHRLINLGEEATKLADALKHERDHNLHRACVACQEFSTQLAHALTALSPSTMDSIRNDN